MQTEIAAQFAWVWWRTSPSSNSAPSFNAWTTNVSHSRRMPKLASSEDFVVFVQEPAGGFLTEEDMKSFEGVYLHNA